MYLADYPFGSWYFIAIKLKVNNIIIDRTGSIEVAAVRRYAGASGMGCSEHGLFRNIWYTTRLIIQEIDMTKTASVYVKMEPQLKADKHLSRCFA
jgi:hypothetical protein